MYDVTAALPDETIGELAPGTSLLIAGPAMSGKQGLALDLLAAGEAGENGLLIVSTTETAESCIDQLEQRVGTVDPGRVGVVDCSGSTQQEAIREIATQRVSSPGDLTGISIATAKLMEQFATQGVSDVRHGLVSVSTLLQYLELDTVFKFLHVYMRRINDTGGLGIFTVDNAAHDQQTISTITNEFDGVIELRESESGAREMRILGMADAARTWHPY